MFFRGDVLFSRNILIVIKSWRMRWAGACGAYGRQDECMQNIGEEIWRKGTTSKAYA
jgi:hypothetical protein